MTISADFDAIPATCDFYLGTEWAGIARALGSVKDVGVALDAGTFTLSAAGAATLASTLSVSGAATFDSTLQADDQIALAEAGTPTWLLKTASGAFSLQDSSGFNALTIADGITGTAIAISAAQVVTLGGQLLVNGPLTRIDDRIALAEAAAVKWDLQTISGQFTLTDNGGNTALTVEDGVIDDAIYVDADGHIGFGTDPTATYDLYFLAAGADPIFRLDGANALNAECLLQLRTAANSYFIEFVQGATAEWRVGVNNSSAFVVEDQESGNDVITVEDGARDNAIYVDADGHIGFGADPTSNGVFWQETTQAHWKLDAAFDAAFQVQLDAGATTAQSCDVNFRQVGSTVWNMGPNSSGHFRIESTSGNTIFCEVAAVGNAIYVDADGHIGFGRNPNSDNFVIDNNANAALTFVLDSGTSAAQTMDLTFSDRGTAHYKIRSLAGSSLLRIRDEISGHNWLNFTEGGGLQVGAPTGGDKGQGTLNASAVYDDNTLLTCYVLDAEIDGAIDVAAWDARVTDLPEVRDEETGRVERPAKVRRHEPARRFAARMARDLDPATFSADFLARRALPAFPTRDEWTEETRLSSGEITQRLWETCEVQAVHIMKLEQRLAALEARP